MHRQESSASREPPRIVQCINSIAFVFVFVVAAALASASLIVALRPLLVRHALAQPNARSLHREPTPQGGGIAVVAATLGLALAATSLAGPGLVEWQQFLPLVGATCGLAVIGAVDDIRPLPALVRLPLQLALVAFAIAALPPGLRLWGWVPLHLERAILVLGLAWFVNLTNFMDGMDWMSVTETLSIAAALAAFTALGVLPAHVEILALALAGAILGFAPFNAPVARLFLGDVGSLPIGLLLGYGLIELALAGDFAAAVLLPLYYLLDTGLTLVRRSLRGQSLLKAHREHFYQLAAARGLSPLACIGRIARVNLVLAGLAFASHYLRGFWPAVGLVALGFLVVATLLFGFVRMKAITE